MAGLSGWKIAGEVGLLCAVVSGGVAIHQVRGASALGSPHTGVVLPNDPTVQACLAARGSDCNPDPSVRETFIANNPIAQPPSRNPHYISEAAAIARARGPMNASAVAHARLMTRDQMQALNPNLTENAAPNPNRKVWLVTVHGDATWMGNPAHKPVVVHVYTVVIDAETNTVTDSCLGCDTLP